MQTLANDLQMLWSRISECLRIQCRMQSNGSRVREGKVERERERERASDSAPMQPRQGRLLVAAARALTIRLPRSGPRT